MASKVSDVVWRPTKAPHFPHLPLSQLAALEPFGHLPPQLGKKRGERQAQMPTIAFTRGRIESHSKVQGLLFIFRGFLHLNISCARFSLPLSLFSCFLVPLSDFLFFFFCQRVCQTAKQNFIRGYLHKLKYIYQVHLNCTMHFPTWQPPPQPFWEPRS